MNKPEPEGKQADKKPYLPPQVQAFQSLKEITLAITCNCDYWAKAGNFGGSCDYCGNEGGQLPCPGLGTANAPSCGDPL